MGDARDGCVLRSFSSPGTNYILPIPFPEGLPAREVCPGARKAGMRSSYFLCSKRLGEAPLCPLTHVSAGLLTAGLQFLHLLPDVTFQLLQARGQGYVRLQSKGHQSPCRPPTSSRPEAVTGRWGSDLFSRVSVFPLGFSFALALSYFLSQPSASDPWTFRAQRHDRPRPCLDSATSS